MQKQIEKDLKALANKEKEEVFKRFFKTGKGEYGEGDQFIGITIPNIRAVCKKYYKDITFDELEFFIKSPIHEYRMFSLLTLTYMFPKADDELRRNIYYFYFKHIKNVNNWDLVDLSAPKIVGEYLKDKKRDVLYGMAESGKLWEQRIAILSTFTFIREKDFKDALGISKILVNHDHDLIHKAVGWMLREIGKRDLSTEEKFLKKYYKNMPRTMLRYAIEKFPETKRKQYLNGVI